WVPDDGTGTASLTANNGFTRRHDFIIKQSAPKGTFGFFLPLSAVFGFCADYTQGMFGFRQDIKMVRQSDNDAIFRTNAAGAGMCEITKISWLMPHIQPNDVRKMALYKQIQDHTSYEAPFRQHVCDTFSVPETTSTTWRVGVRTAPEKPAFIIIGLQTAKAGNQEKNVSIFDHCKLKDMHVVLNTTRYPQMDYLTDFDKMQFSQVFKSFDDFPMKYYGVDKLLSNSSVDPTKFKTLFPLQVFDVSKQSERLLQGIVDITVKMSFHANCPANTQAYALVISNRILKIRSDGQKMDVIH
ncbi:MAG: hypothetical protein ABGX32_00055, partial [Methylococcales bacterium]